MKISNIAVPLFLLILINALGLFALSFTIGVMENFYFTLGVLGALFFSNILILIFKMGDGYMFLIVSVLLSIGIIMLLRLGTESAMRQITWFYVGIPVFFVTFILYSKFNIWKKLTLYYFAVSIVMFVVTLTLGSSIFGARNWIIVAGISIQPSEIIKLLFVLFLAGVYLEYKEPSELMSKLRLGKINREVLIMGMVYIFLGFLVLAREWGLAMLYFLIYTSMQFVFGKNRYIMPFNLVFGGIGATLGTLTMAHIRMRIDVWRDPFKDAGEMGYQIVQSLYALASGGFTGTGLGLGSPGNIPVVKSDFIFSAICEEFGTLMGVSVIVLFFLLVYRGLKLSLRVTDPFNKAVAFGISVMFGFQVFIIVGGVTKFIPMTGITLPFMSAGGSSLVSSFAALAILQAISSKEGEIADDI